MKSDIVLLFRIEGIERNGEGFVKLAKTSVVVEGSSVVEVFEGEVEELLMLVAAKAGTRNKGKNSIFMMLWRYC